MKARLILVDAERERRSWLRHHVEVLWPEAQIEERDPSALSPEDLADTDLILFGTRCAEDDAGEAGLAALPEWLAQARPARGHPPIVVIADGGNELCAVQALRHGAADYLPRRLLTPQRLANLLHRTLRVARTPSRARVARASRRRIDPSHLSLPQYTIIHKLGESGRAVVYLAHSAALDREVALKISKPVVEAGSRRDLERERAAVSALHHASIVQIYDYGFHDGHEFLAMEYFPCGDLKARLQHPITLLESLVFTQRICGALQVVHAAGLVHRDLKPPNVMLRPDGSVVLIDFGLAQGVEGHTQTTAAGVLRGSPYYMSPEQAQGLPLDSRSDLYSLGVILFEMLSGTKPYTGNSAMEVMQQHVQGPRPALPPACAALEPLLERLMARDREARFADAAEAYAALMQAVAECDETARMPAAVA